MENKTYKKRTDSHSLIQVWIEKPLKERLEKLLFTGELSHLVRTHLEEVVEQREQAKQQKRAS